MISPVNCGTGSGCVGLRRARRGAQQVAEAAEPDAGLLVAVEDLREFLHRAEERVQVEEERDEFAGAQGAGAQPGRAEAEHEGAGDAAQQADEREVDGDVALRPDPRVPVGRRLREEAFPVAGLPDVDLGDPQPGDVLLQATR